MFSPVLSDRYHPLDAAADEIVATSGSVYYCFEFVFHSLSLPCDALVSANHGELRALHIALCVISVSLWLIHQPCRFSVRCKFVNAASLIQIALHVYRLFSCVCHISRQQSEMSGSYKHGEIH